MLQVISSWGNGQMFVYADRKEQEVAQGENAFLAATYQSIKLCVLGDVAYLLSDGIANSSARLAAQIASSIFPIFASGITIVAATTKQNQYAKIAAFSDTFPKSLSVKTEQGLRFWADHVGQLTKGGMITGIVGLIQLGHSPLVAGAMLAPFIYQAAEDHQLIPMRVRLVTEKYFTNLAQIAGMLGGSPVNRILGGIVGAIRLIPYSATVTYLIDDLMHDRWQLKGPSLREIDAAPVMQRHLSFEQIETILHAPIENFFISHSYCNQSPPSLQSLEEDHKFDHYITYFNAVDWTQRISFLKKRFQDDDRFIECVRSHFVGQNYQRENIDIYLERLKKPDQTKEQFLVARFTDQFYFFIGVLKGEIEPKGHASDIVTTQQAAAVILAQFPQLSLREREDLLLKLGIEAGEYCARGMRSTCVDIVEGLTLQDGDALLRHEHVLHLELLRFRKQILDVFYLHILELLRKPQYDHGPDDAQVTDVDTVAIAQDLHYRDLFYSAMALGFISLTPAERDSINSQLLVWKQCADVREMMYTYYQEHLPEFFKALPQAAFSDYILGIIETYPTLSDEEKNMLRDHIADQTWGNETSLRFFYMALVRLGALRYTTPIATEWVEISKSDIDPEWVCI